MTNKIIFNNIFKNVRVAQWIARKASNLKVWGSSPHMDNYIVKRKRSRAVKGARLKILCILLREFEPHRLHFYL